MKKILSFLLCISILLSFCVPALAEDTAEYKQVLLSVKERMPQTEQYPNFESSTAENNGIMQYYFKWWLNDNSRGTSVTALSNGLITQIHSFGDFDSWSNTPSINKKTYAEALPYAKKIVEKINPSLKDDLVVYYSKGSDSLYDNNYRFEIKRVHNNTDIGNEYGYLNLSSDLETIVSYDMNCNTRLTFAEGASISADDAKKAFKEKIGLELRYYYDYNKEKIGLRYIQKNDGNYINALDGSVIKPDVYEHLYYANGMGGFAKDAKAEASSFSTAELKEITNIDGLIPKTEVVEKLASNKVLDIPSKDKLSYSNLDNYEDEYSYSFGYEDGLNVTVNAKTGEILSFYSGKYDDNKDFATDEKALEIAKKATEVLCPDKIKEYKVDTVQNGYVTYRRYVNGIIFDDCVTVNVDSDGTISSYYISYTDEEFPKPDNIITADEAADKLFAKTEYKTMYLPTCSDIENIKYNDKAELIYVTKDNYIDVDAFTGELNNLYDDKDNVADYTDISGHYAEKQIEALAKFGIGFPDAELSPDKAITQSEFAQLLDMTFSTRQPYIIEKVNDSSYMNIISDGIIKESEKKPDEIVTRELSAKYLARAIGAETFIDLDIYKPLYPDVSSNIGAINILTAMGIYKGDESGKFNPSAQLSRADAMIIIYNYVTK